MIGSIPEKLVYICRPKTEISFKWEDSEEQISKYSVQPVFISDASNKKTIESGRSWATQKTWVHKPIPGKPHNGEYVDNSNPEFIEFDNTPINDVRIVGYDHRSEGGGCYKAIIKDRFYVDFRDDVMLDSIYSLNIDKGLIKGDFVWARVGSTMKLVRVDSWLHKEMIKATAKGEAKPIKDLQIGGVYSSKTGKAIFLGYYNGYTYEETKTPLDNYSSNGYSYYRYYKYKKVKHNNSLLFNTSWNFKDDKLDFDFSHTYGFEVKKSHSYKEKIGQVNLQLDLMDVMRDIADKKLKERKYTDIYREFVYIAGCVIPLSLSSTPSPLLDKLNNKQYIVES